MQSHQNELEEKYRKLLNIFAQGKYNEVIYEASIILESNRNSKPFINITAASLAKLGRHRDAIGNYLQLLEIDNEISEVYFNIALSQKIIQDYESSIDSFKKCIKLNPSSYKSYANLASLQIDLGLKDEAIKNIQFAIEIRKDYPNAFNILGLIYQKIGEYDKSIEAFEKALSVDPNFHDADLNLSNIRTYKGEETQIDRIKNLMKNKQDERLDFVMAKYYEDIGNYKNAFIHLLKANTLIKKQNNYHITKDESLFRDIYDFDKRNSRFFKVTDINFKSEITPIFIVGMPRSGTTLIEQILSRHSEISALGELNYFHSISQRIIRHKNNFSTDTLNQIRSEYRGSFEKILGKNKIFTDKLPLNFMFVNLIIASFPNAKILHVQRLKEAVCWSNFRVRFTSSIGYSNNLKDIYKFYELYEELMKYWEVRYPSRIINIDYESLTKQPEERIREMFSSLGIGFEHKCLSPHASNRIVQTASRNQVNKKIYSGSSDFWRNYEKYF